MLLGAQNSTMDRLEVSHTNHGYTPESKANTSLHSRISLDTNFSERSYRYRSSLGSLTHALDRSWRSKRERRRLIDKNGECNVSNVHVKARNRRYIADIFTTLIDMKWRWILLLFALAFVVSWTCFALLWLLICLQHGDLRKSHNNEDWKPCVENLNGYTSALLFSIETQHTIGYGSRMTTEECPLAIMLMMMQSCFGVIIQALMTGLVFAKLARAKKRAETLIFSKRAVINTRDGRLCLLFRLGDMRLSHLIQTTIRGVLVKKHITQEGETLPLAEYEVPFGTESGTNSLLLMWPVILEHHIDESSPFWEISADDIEMQSFELIIIMEGVIESTGMTTQARTSYLPGEITWGERFERLVALQRDNGQYAIDYSRFNNTIKVDCTRLSAKQLAEGQIEDDGDSVSDESQAGAPGSPDSNCSRRTSTQTLSASDLSRLSRSSSASSTSLTDIFCTPVLSADSPVRSRLSVLTECAASGNNGHMAVSSNGSGDATSLDVSAKDGTSPATVRNRAMASPVSAAVFAAGSSSRNGVRSTDQNVTSQADTVYSIVTSQSSVSAFHGNPPGRVNIYSV